MNKEQLELITSVYSLKERVKELEEQLQGMHMMYDIRLAKFDKVESRNKRYHKALKFVDEELMYVLHSKKSLDTKLFYVENAKRKIDEALEKKD